MTTVSERRLKSPWLVQENRQREKLNVAFEQVKLVILQGFLIFKILLEKREITWRKAGLMGARTSPINVFTISINASFWQKYIMSAVVRNVSKKESVRTGSLLNLSPRLT